MVAVEYCPRLVAAYFHATRSGTLGVHEIPVGRPAKIVNDEAFIFIPWETGFALGRDPLTCPEPAASASFLPFSSQICVREKPFPLFGKQKFSNLRSF